MTYTELRLANGRPWSLDELRLEHNMPAGLAAKRGLTEAERQDKTRSQRQARYSKPGSHMKARQSITRTLTEACVHCDKRS
ncbi:hypothetical protein NDU88_005564 [Pleurodeles waltl]|uniref:Uncharacterized protein n=1 Tax=Pleurodeles waltl TaxID=8319 RepID=A0AAV7TUM1_PLEWA|nr:hypothetical protein NDU88_005564 [Pleurodeles waltl]